MIWQKFLDWLGFGHFGHGEPLREGAAVALLDEAHLAREINRWLSSPRRRLQVTGQKYYDGEHDKGQTHLFLQDEDGAPIIPDRKVQPPVTDNQYAKAVDQKVNYLFGKPFKLQCESDEYTGKLTYIFDKNFRRLLQEVATDAYNGGIAWIHPYIDEAGELAFRHFPAHEILPIWKNDDHFELDMAVRYYVTIGYIGDTERNIEHIDVYTRDNIRHYLLERGGLLPQGETPYAVREAQDENGGSVGAENLNWRGIIPLVPFKCDAHEIPLIKRAKELQDALNLTRTNWTRTMNEDIRDTILVLRNYDGQSPEEFRRNLVKYGIVKVSDDGGLESLRIERDASNYTTYINELRRAIVENTRSFDAKDDRTGANPNEMNLRSMYSDIDLDADRAEIQFQASFDRLLAFVDMYLATTGQGDYSAIEVTLTFDRNMIVNDAEIIANIRNSSGIVSNETLLSRHPFVADVDAEKARLEKEAAAAALPDNYGNFGKAEPPKGQEDDE